MDNELDVTFSALLTTTAIRFHQEFKHNAYY